MVDDMMISMTLYRVWGSGFGCKFNSKTKKCVYGKIYDAHYAYDAIFSNKIVKLGAVCKCS